MTRTVRPETAVDGSAAADAVAGAPAREAETLRHEIAGLRATIAARATLDMACGVVMAVGRCSLHEASGALLAAAAATDTGVEEFAGLLVEGIGGAELADPVRSALRTVLAQLPPTSAAAEAGR
ncbi:hypothetical protein OG552_34710 [Streptomyces sp. NBC_01476]|uniref:hypothetical protein n=1 Tax=Streptomyces sp. NBC_01476 TaxID=2903881 RepID=UPI002E37EA68|nr:hypothetical protein [Streptomyces sp. NBC_01476]